MSTSATAHDLVAVLNHGLEDTTRTDEILAELQDNLARTGQWMAFSSTTAPAATLTFTAPTVIELEAIFASGYDLTRTNANDLEIHPEWREEVGPLEAYTVDQEADLVVRFYPKPDVTYSIFAVHGTRRTNWQTWLSPWLALEITAKEFQREGPEQDVAYAQAAAAVADFIAKGLLRITNAERP